MRIRHVDGQIGLKHLGQPPKHLYRLIQCHFKKEQEEKNISRLETFDPDQNTCLCPFNVLSTLPSIEANSCFAHFELALI